MQSGKHAANNGFFYSHLDFFFFFFTVNLAAFLQQDQYLCFCTSQTKGLQGVVFISLNLFYKNLQGNSLSKDMVNFSNIYHPARDLNNRWIPILIIIIKKHKDWVSSEFRRVVSDINWQICTDLFCLYFLLETKWLKAALCTVCVSISEHQM